MGGFSRLTQVASMYLQQEQRRLSSNAASGAARRSAKVFRCTTAADMEQQHASYHLVSYMDIGKKKSCRNAQCSWIFQFSVFDSQRVSNSFLFFTASPCLAQPFCWSKKTIRLGGRAPQRRWRTGDVG